MTSPDPLDTFHALNQALDSIFARAARLRKAKDIAVAAQQAEQVLAQLRLQPGLLRARIDAIDARLEQGRLPRQHHATWERERVELDDRRNTYEAAVRTAEGLLQQHEASLRQLQARVNEPDRASLPRPLLALGAGLLVICVCGVSGLALVSSRNSMPTPAADVSSKLEAADMETRAAAATQQIASAAVDRPEATAQATHSADEATSPMPATPATVTVPTASASSTAPAAAPAQSTEVLVTPATAEPATRTPTPKAVAARAANIREGPGTNYPVVGGVKAEQALDPVEQTAAGDWLRLAAGGWIAAQLVANAPDGLPVAVAIPPPPSPTATSRPKPAKATPTAAPAVSRGKVQITYVNYDGGVYRVESDEYAVIKNVGGAPVDMSGWLLNAGDNGQNFWFPSGFVLRPGQECRVYTNEIHPETCGLSFYSGRAIWNNKGDCGLLLEAGGELASQYCY